MIYWRHYFLYFYYVKKVKARLSPPRFLQLLDNKMEKIYIKISLLGNIKFSTKTNHFLKQKIYHIIYLSSLTIYFSSQKFPFKH